MIKGVKPYPHEEFAARAISRYFNAEVTYVKRSNVAKSADFLINNAIYEVKSPIGDSKRTIQNNLRIADDQSTNVIINLVRCKMRQETAVRRIKYELERANKIKRLLIVLKNGEIIDIK